MHHGAFVLIDLESENLVAGLVEDVLWYFSVVVVKIDHDLVVKVAQNGCD